MRYSYTPIYFLKAVYFHCKRSYQSCHPNKDVADPPPPMQATFYKCSPCRRIQRGAGRPDPLKGCAAAYLTQWTRASKDIDQTNSISRILIRTHGTYLSKLRVYLLRNQNFHLWLPHHCLQELPVHKLIL